MMNIEELTAKLYAWRERLHDTAGRDDESKAHLRTLRREVDEAYFEALRERDADKRVVAHIARELEPTEFTDRAGR